MVVIRRSALLLLLAALAGCGGSSTANNTRTAGTEDTTKTNSLAAAYTYDRAVPLKYSDRGPFNRFQESGFVPHDVTFRADGARVDGFLLLPKGAGRHPAVVVVHGADGDRSELLPEAGKLTKKGFVALTITEPSSLSPIVPKQDPIAYLRQLRHMQIRDVVAIRRAVDVLQTLPQVDPNRIGYLGWSAGGRNGTFIGATEPRVKALALLSTGAAPLSEFVAQAPPNFRKPVRQILSDVDPLRAMTLGRAGTVLLEDGRRDQIVPRAALVNMIHAAPPRTVVRWYDTPHELNDAAYDAAVAWLQRKLAR
jgi:poly(3-hydroxybutyrate) depolymerase